MKAHENVRIEAREGRYGLRELERERERERACVMRERG